MEVGCSSTFSGASAPNVANGVFGFTLAVGKQSCAHRSRIERFHNIAHYLQVLSFVWRKNPLLHNRWTIPITV